jgi:hypothetical protein
LSNARKSATYCTPSKYYKCMGACAVEGVGGVTGARALSATSTHQLEPSQRIGVN